PGFLGRGFHGAEFLERSLADQRGYVSTQLVMASSIAARIKPDLADCIGAEFFDGSGMSAELLPVSWTAT
ncbi:MAG: hypothetical protein HEP70_20370, partial [Rhodobiaceae bacterium]|nr:hypothetical protein [Rhodobiaceae bacterium]